MKERVQDPIKAVYNQPAVGKQIRASYNHMIQSEIPDIIAGNNDGLVYQQGVNPGADNQLLKIPERKLMSEHMILYDWLCLHETEEIELRHCSIVRCKDSGVERQSSDIDCLEQGSDC